jgi:hypothetical protein
MNGETECNDLSLVQAYQNYKGPYLIVIHDEFS